MFAGLWPGFDERRGADQLGHQRRARADLGRAARSSSWRARRSWPARPRPTAWEDIAARRRRPPSGRSAACCAARLVDEVRRRLRTSWLQRGASEAELGWIDSVLDPDVLTIGFARRVPSYKRLTLMLRDPERLTRAAARPGAADPARHRRQGPPGRRRRQGAGPADRPVRRRRAACGTGSCSCRTTTSAWPRPLPRLRRLAEQPAAPAGGVRHVRHEVRAQRRPQPLDPRRLVGRVVRRRERLGDPDRRRRDRPRPPRRPRGRRALRADREEGRPAVLRPGRRRRCRPAGSRWCATRCRPSARRCSPAGWCATTCSSSTRPPPVGAARSTAASSAARELAAWKARVRAAWPAVRVDHVEAAGVGDAPEVGSTLEVRAFVSLGELSPDDVDGAGRCTAGSTSTTRSPARPRCRCATRRPTRAVATGTSATSPLGPAGAVRLHRARRAAPPPGGDPGRAGAGHAAAREQRHGRRDPPVAAGLLANRERSSSTARGRARRGTSEATERAMTVASRQPRVQPRSRRAAPCCTAVLAVARALSVCGRRHLRRRRRLTPRPACGRSVGVRRRPSSSDPAAMMSWSVQVALAALAGSDAAAPVAWSACRAWRSPVRCSPALSRQGSSTAGRRRRGTSRRSRHGRTR